MGPMAKWPKAKSQEPKANSQEPKANSQLANASLQINRVRLLQIIRPLLGEVFHTPQSD